MGLVACSNPVEEARIQVQEAVSLMEDAEPWKWIRARDILEGALSLDSSNEEAVALLAEVSHLIESEQALEDAYILTNKQLHENAAKRILRNGPELKSEIGSQLEELLEFNLERIWVTALDNDFSESYSYLSNKYREVIGAESLTNESRIQFNLQTELPFSLTQGSDPFVLLESRLIEAAKIKFNDYSQYEACTAEARQYSDRQSLFESLCVELEQQAVAEVFRQADSFLRSGEPQEAVSILAKWTSVLPSDEDLDALFEQAKYELDEQKRQAKLAAAKAEQDRKDAAVASMTKVSDDFYDDKFYWYDRATYSRYVDDRFRIFYVTRPGYVTTLYLNVMYYGSSWVFWDEFRLNIDGRIVSRQYSYFDITRDNSGRGVWEHITVRVDREDYRMLESIARAESVKVRFRGDDYYSDYSLSKAEIRAISNVLLAYEAAGGEVP